MEQQSTEAHITRAHIARQQVDWSRFELEELIAIQRSVRDAVEAKRKLVGKLKRANSGERLLPEPLYMGKAGYRTQVTHVAPARLRSCVDKIDKCILGVSLGGANAASFAGAKLEAVVRWMAVRVNHCCILVGDSLGRISLQVREGMDPVTAEREARALGQRYAAENEAIFRRYSTDQITFEFRYGTAYADHPSFRPYLDNVRANYQADASFRELVHAFGDEYLARTLRSTGREVASDGERYRQIAHEYLLEEIALLSCFAEDGFPVLVYPGSIDSIVEIAEGRFPALPAPLRGLGFIALWLDAKSGAR